MAVRGLISRDSASSRFRQLHHPRGGRGRWIDKLCSMNFFPSSFFCVSVALSRLLADDAISQWRLYAAMSSWQRHLPPFDDDITTELRRRHDTGGSRAITRFAMTEIAEAEDQSTSIFLFLLFIEGRRSVGSNNNAKKKGFCCQRTSHLLKG